MNRAYLADSKEWYIDEEQAQAYLDIMSTSYAAGIVEGEDALLTQVPAILEHAYGGQPRKYVDLGPGDGVKTNALISVLHNKGLVTNYEGVDIQARYLDIADQIMKKKNIPSTRFVGSFENYLLERSLEERSFIYLGATYGNFETDFDEQMIAGMHPEDMIYLSSALFPENIENVIAGYKGAKNMFVPIGKKQGLHPDSFDAQFNTEKNQIELGFIKDDTFYVVGISKKPTEAQFKARVEERFDGNFIANKAHIGFVGKLKE